MFSGKSVEKHAFFLLIDRIKGKEGGIHYIIYISGRRGSWGWLDLWVLQVLWVWWVLHGVVGIAGCGGYCRNYPQEGVSKVQNYPLYKSNSQLE